MIDPIGSFRQIRDNYALYVKTAFGTRFPSLERDREQMLLRSDAESAVMHQEPWIEPLPRYKEVKPVTQLDPQDMPGFTVAEIRRFSEFAQCGLIGSFNLFAHQIAMLRTALLTGRAVVTAGTGSGKTEAFLLPLMAAIVKESVGWESPREKPEGIDDWWLESRIGWQNARFDARLSARVSQRANGRRPAALRGLILYPMNALVEDQMTRLRKAMDSERARTWFDRNSAGNRIYFGRYNSSTPKSGRELQSNGRPDRKKIRELAIELNQTACDADAAQRHAIDNPDDGDVVYFFPRLDGAEMRSRWDMQDAPPDLLITNYSMLSVMLMRDVDRAIFDQTAVWLRDDPNAVFHLVVDELHLYRGTQGTEVALLLRLLLKRLGLNPSSPKLRILASSASLERNADSLEFLRDFFGGEWRDEHIISGEPAPIPSAPTSRLPMEAFADLARALDSDPSGQGESVDRACDAIADTLGGGSGSSSLSKMTTAFLKPDSPGRAMLFQGCRDGTSLKATALSKYAERVFGSDGDPRLREEAARGLLIARCLCDRAGIRPDLPSFRLHWFFRNVDGLWAATRAIDADAGRTAGKLYPASRLLSDEAEGVPSRVLELLYCEQCGTTLFGGSRLPVDDGSGGYELLPCDHDIEGIPDKQAARFVDRRSYGEFAVFWPNGRAQLHQDSAGEWAQNQLIGEDIDAADRRGRWIAASLDITSAIVVPGRSEPDNPNLVHGHLFCVRTLPEHEERVSALPCICPSCSADYSRRWGRTSPVRGFRTGFSKIAQLLAKESFYMLPEVPARKLVVFSDSREDAARISNGIERNHYNDLVREAMYDELLMAVEGEQSYITDVTTTGHAVSEKAKQYAEANAGRAEELKKAIEDARLTTPPGLPEAVVRLIRETKDAGVKKLQDAATRAESRVVQAFVLFQGISNPLSTGFLTDRLRRIGVNPAGNDNRYQDYQVDGRWEHWTRMFDFNSAAGWQALRQPPSGNEIRAREILTDKVQSEIASILWDKSYFGFESAGLGYCRLRVGSEELAAMGQRCGAPPGVFEAIVLGFLRIMGDLKRYPSIRPDNQNQVLERPVASSIETKLSPRDLVAYARDELFGELQRAIQRAAFPDEGVASRLAEEGVLPMFGMPTRTRVLYHGVKVNNEPETIDRDLDLAITEFAPGSQKTKDKKVYTSIGFTPALLKMGIGVQAAPGQALTGRQFRLRCERCQHTQTGPADFTEQTCPRCGEPRHASGLDSFAVAVPAGFRTDFTEGKDIRDDSEFIQAGNSTIAESNAVYGDEPAQGTNALAMSSYSTVYRLNTRRGELFTGRSGQLTSTQKHPRPRLSLPRQWIDHRFEPGARFTPEADQHERIALVAPKMTDLLRLMPANVPLGISFDPVPNPVEHRGSFEAAASAKGAYYSAAFILRTVAAMELDIDPDEINISCLRAVPRPDGGFAGEIILSDHLPNGAGFVEWMGQRLEWLFKESLGAGERNLFFDEITKESHRKACDLSCPDCIRHYRNLSYHGLLDWRLGLSLLRILKDETHQCGLDNSIPFSEAFSFPELIDWPSYAGKLRDQLCANFPWQPKVFGELPGFTFRDASNRVRSGVMIHPLWSRDVITGRLAASVAAAGDHSSPGRCTANAGVGNVIGKELVIVLSKRPGLVGPGLESRIKIRKTKSNRLLL